MELTLQQFDALAAKCREIFVKKTHDYGTSWRILRPSSLTDQLYIKAWRIRSIEEKGVQQVSDSIADEFIGLINYSIIALIQNELPENTPLELPLEAVTRLYDEQLAETRRLLQQKNHDYGEIWRELRISSMTDLILSKLLRIRQIEDNSGQTIASEGVDANYRDIINYAIFALIKLS
ncbi:MAG: DUF1599 domain-containing protein [Saprospiraceae bacterium]|nr:DUF1599 domain-containing protein [Saprospiraceae bacterium]